MLSDTQLQSAVDVPHFGITDIRYLRAEGVRVSPEAKQKAIEATHHDVIQLVAA